MAVAFVPTSLSALCLCRNKSALLDRRMRAWRPDVSSGGSCKSSLLHIRDLGTALVRRADGMVLGARVADDASSSRGRVLKENEFARRTVEVDVGKKPIATGTYAVVCHGVHLVPIPFLDSISHATRRPLQSILKFQPRDSLLADP